MQLDKFRGMVAEAIGGEGLEVFCEFPDAAKRVGGAPFGVLSQESIELKALGFGRCAVRRGLLKFCVTVYAKDGDAAADAMRKIAARCAGDRLRALLGDSEFSVKGARDGKLGLCAVDAELSGSALIELGSGEDAEVIVLNLRGRLVEKTGEEGEI